VPLSITSQESTNNIQRPETAGASHRVSRTKSSEGVDKSHEVSTADKVELSSQARAIQHAREVAQSAPEIRADKVEAARRAVKDGTLNLQGKDIAGKLLQDALPR
jgi:flagellar biosynthesis anti-sigma factor FlgM